MQGLDYFESSETRDQADSGLARKGQKCSKRFLPERNANLVHVIPFVFSVYFEHQFISNNKAYYNISIKNNNIN